MPEDDFLSVAGERLREKLSFASRLLANQVKGTVDMQSALGDIRQRMSRLGAHVRDPAGIEKAVSDAWRLYSDLKEGISVGSAAELPEAFRTLDLCLTQALYLEAISEYLEKGGRSRGSYMVLDPRVKLE